MFLKTTNWYWGLSTRPTAPAAASDNFNEFNGWRGTYVPAPGDICDKSTRVKALTIIIAQVSGTSSYKHRAVEGIREIRPAANALKTHKSRFKM